MTQYVDIQYIRNALGITGTKDSCKGCKYNGRIGFACNTYEAPSFAYVCEVLDDAPIVEAEPVRHGRWVERWVDNKHRIGDRECSVCGGVMLDCPSYSLYCPWCGARMDAERKEE